ncbi:hypothetical protein AVEN_266636-1 [Araneus ventricosus]|uniref:Uncharacterized protein n=1 Tax=Araneus ventricosus TaxID=182803 RepID=A0A4Y2CBT4_ARAVE|nr:hypothetical protein AVEN_266636-1 [Araneus ventricosus]
MSSDSWDSTVIKMRGVGECLFSSLTYFVYGKVSITAEIWADTLNTPNPLKTLRKRIWSESHRPKLTMFETPALLHMGNLRSEPHKPKLNYCFKLLPLFILAQFYITALPTRLGIYLFKTHNFICSILKGKAFDSDGGKAENNHDTENKPKTTSQE